MNPHFAKTLLALSLGAFAVAASGENATPRDNPAGANTINATENGTQTGNTAQGSYNSAPISNQPAGTMASPSGATIKYRALSDTDIRSYKDARGACDRLAGAQRDTCRTQFASTWSQVDPKCQKVSGSALDDCLKGADHGGQ
jgi:hypothetical protein